MITKPLKVRVMNIEQDITGSTLQGNDPKTTLPGKILTGEPQEKTRDNSIYL